jgi:hypothetical protein
MRPGDTRMVWELDRLVTLLWGAPSTLYRYLPGGQSALREGWAQRVG